MARRRRAEKRTVTPDPKYNSDLVTKIINYVMERGKKSTSEQVVYGALDQIRDNGLSPTPFPGLGRTELHHCNYIYNFCPNSLFFQNI